MGDTASRRGQGILLALVSAAGFSTLGLFAKLVYAEGWSVAETLAWRFTFSAALLWAIVLVARRPLPKPAWPVLALGLLGFAPQAGLYFLTLRYLDPGITSLLLYTYPSFVLVLGFVLWRRRPNPVQVLCLLLSLGGCVVAFWRRGSYPVTGLALGVAVGFAYGAYLVAGERVLKGVDSISATALIMLMAALVYWSVTIATGKPRLPSSAAVLGGLSGIALLATVLPITTLFASMRRIGAADTSLVSTIEPVLTVALSAIVLGERLGAAQYAGGAMILAAVVILGIKERRG